MKWTPILILALCGCAAPKVAGPPLPPMPKLARPHFASLATTLAVPTKTYWLAWNYTSDTNHIVFNVRSIETNRLVRPDYSWPIVGVTNGLRWPFQINPSAQCVWFTVTASNTVNGLESDFAQSQP